MARPETSRRSGDRGSGASDPGDAGGLAISPAWIKVLAGGLPLLGGVGGFFGGRKEPGFEDRFRTAERVLRPGLAGLLQQYQGQAENLRNRLAVSFGTSGAFNTGAGQAASEVSRAFFGASAAESEFNFRRMAAELASGMSMPNQASGGQRALGGIAQILASPEYADLIRRIFGGGNP